MGDQHGGGIDQRIAAEGRFLAKAFVDPGRRQAESGLLDVGDPADSTWAPVGSMARRSG
jgi:hypothetical protein